MTEEFCKTAGHAFEARKLLEYDPPEYGSSELPIDFPVLMVILSMIGELAATSFAVTREAVWIMGVPSVFLFAALSIYCFSRFKMVHKYDICARCGQIKK